MKFLLLFLSLTLFCNSSLAETIHLTKDNVVTYRAVVDYNSVADMQYALQNLVMKRGLKDYPIYLVLDCPGGDIYDGEQFIQFAKMVPNLHTITLFAASMCAGIGQALPGKRYVTANGVYMFHRAQGQFQGQFETGEVEAQLNLWKNIVRGMEQRNANRIGISLEKYKDKIVNEWWIYGNDNVKSGAADQVVDLTCSNALIEDKQIIVTETFFGKEETVISGCPLFR